MGLIYMRISPCGGKYIGQTILKEEERWKKHVREAYYLNGQNYNTYLNKAIRKYGSDSFLVQILEDEIPNELLNEKEQYWIDYYKTYYKDNQHGYNMTRGGDGHKLLNINNNELISLWEQGMGINEIATHFNCERQAIRDRLLGLKYTSHDLFRRRTELATTTKYNKNYDKQQILTLWNNDLSITKIAEIIDQDRHSIAKVLRKYGIDDHAIEKRRIQSITSSNKKPIIQYDKNNNYIQEWESLSEAARQLHLYSSNIAKVLQGKRKTTGGFIFKYKEKNNDN